MSVYSQTDGCDKIDFQNKILFDIKDYVNKAVEKEENTKMLTQN